MKRVLWIRGNQLYTEKEARFLAQLIKQLKKSEIIHFVVKQLSSAATLMMAMQRADCQEMAFSDELTVQNHMDVIAQLIYMGINPLVPDVRKAEENEEPDYHIGREEGRALVVMEGYKFLGYKRAVGLSMHLEDV